MNLVAKPVAPSRPMVARPSGSSTAPPVYRPNPGGVQRMPAPSAQWRLQPAGKAPAALVNRAAPPVYQPNPPKIQRMAAPSAAWRLQPAASTAQRQPARAAAPAAYRATALESRGAPASALGLTSAGKPAGPPAFPPQPAVAGLQLKAAGPAQPQPRGPFYARPAAFIQRMLSERDPLLPSLSLSDDEDNGPDISLDTHSHDHYVKYKKSSLKGNKIARTTVLRRLGLAANAIAKVKQMIPAIGNIEEDVLGTSGESYARMRLARDEADEYKPGFFSFLCCCCAQDKTSGDSMVRSAVAAMRAGGGNCAEHANLTYFTLLEDNSGETISRCSMRDNIDHAFVLVGDPNEEETLVVADAWAKQPFAVSYDDWTFAGFNYVTYRQDTSRGQDDVQQLFDATRGRDRAVAVKRQAIGKSIGKNDQAIFKKYKLNPDDLGTGFYSAPTTITEDAIWHTGRSTYAPPTEKQLEAGRRLASIFGTEPSGDLSGSFV